MLVKKVHVMKGEENYNKPELVLALAGHRVISVACGQYHSCCISDRGDVFTGKESRTLGQGEANMDNCLEPRRVGILSKSAVLPAALRAPTSPPSAAPSTSGATTRVAAWGWGPSAMSGSTRATRCPPSAYELARRCRREVICCGDAHVVVLTDYYHSDQVPERIDEGGAALATDEVYKPPPSSCCSVQ